MTSQFEDMFGNLAETANTFIFMFNQGDIGSTIKLFENYFNVKRVNVLLSSDVVEF